MNVWAGIVGDFFWQACMFYHISLQAATDEILS
jgi:hypothetical protein